MKILCCGDREWSNAQVVREALTPLANQGHEVIHGACRGADTIAGAVATKLGFPVTPFPADWDKYKRAAGPIRNTQMLKAGPDLVLAFHNNLDESKGTRNMVEQARKAGVKVRVIKEPSYGS